jgi:hypothetical protein
VTHTDWRDALESAKAAGHDRIAVWKRGSEPSNYDRARVEPGLLGTCIGYDYCTGEFLVQLNVSSVEAWLGAI